MTPAYDGRAIANFVLDFCESDGRSITHLSLQKVIYFCHVWSLIKLDRPLIKQKFEAWEFGPVLPHVYRDFKSFGDRPVSGRATQIDPMDGKHRKVEYNFDAESNSLLRTTVSFYSRLRPSDLVKLSHVDGGPWHKVWFHGGLINPGMKIDDAAISEFYSNGRSFPFQ